MVAVAARMTPVTPNPSAIDPQEVARAELVEALARMVNRVIQHGKAEAQSALGSIAEIRTTLAGVANIDDFLGISRRRSERFASICRRESCSMAAT
jgi:hypothetical protein